MQNSIIVFTLTKSQHKGLGTKMLDTLNNSMCEQVIKQHSTQTLKWDNLHVHVAKRLHNTRVKQQQTRTKDTEVIPIWKQTASGKIGNTV